MGCKNTFLSIVNNPTKKLARANALSLQSDYYIQSSGYWVLDTIVVPPITRTDRLGRSLLVGYVLLTAYAANFLMPLHWKNGPYSGTRKLKSDTLM